MSVIGVLKSAFAAMVSVRPTADNARHQFKAANQLLNRRYGVALK